jgi:hypothetical protein
MVLNGSSEHGSMIELGVPRRRCADQPMLLAYLLRRALGALFFSLYSARSVLEKSRKPRPINAEGRDGTPGRNYSNQLAFWYA